MEDFSQDSRILAPPDTGQLFKMTKAFIFFPRLHFLYNFFKFVVKGTEF